MPPIRAWVYGVTTGGASFVFLTLWMRGNMPFDALISVIIGVAIVSVVGTGKDERNVSADAAWQAAAPDLPPYSERVALEHDHYPMPVPVPVPAKPRRRTEKKQEAQ